MAYLTFSFSRKSRKKSSNVCKIMNSDGLDTRNWIFRVPEIAWNQPKMGLQNKLNKSILLRIFLPDFEKRPNMLTIWQKDEVFNFPEKPISIWQFEIPKNRNPNFRYPIVINHDLDVYVTITFTTTCSGY